MFNASRLDRVYYCKFIKSLSIRLGKVLPLLRGPQQKFKQLERHVAKPRRLQVFNLPSPLHTLYWKMSWGSQNGTQNDSFAFFPMHGFWGGRLLWQLPSKKIVTPCFHGTVLENISTFQNTRRQLRQQLHSLGGLLCDVANLSRIRFGSIFCSFACPVPGKSRLNYLNHDCKFFVKTVRWQQIENPSWTMDFLRLLSTLLSIHNGII